VGGIEQNSGCWYSSIGLEDWTGYGCSGQIHCSSDSKLGMGAPGFNYVLRAVYDYANYMWNENDLGYENKLQQWEVEYKKYMINQEEMWGDLTRNIIVQEKPQWVQATRFHKYHYREIPDDDDCKSMLGW
jgi:hypothetical protein